MLACALAEYVWPNQTPDAAGNLDVTNPEVRGDIELLAKARDTNEIASERCYTALGNIVFALAVRRSTTAMPLTIMSCDNLPGNGDTLARVLAQFCSAVDPELGAWVKDTGNVMFPNSMVDRITPKTTEATISHFQAVSGLVDEWPVAAEDYSQWYLEDKFVVGRPEWENIDPELAPGECHIVDDVRPYELMKLRLLNGAHSALAYISALVGHDKVDAALADPSVRKFTEKYMACVQDTVPTVPNVNLDRYRDTLLNRFSNEAISDQISRLCEDGSKKMQGFIVPALEVKLNSKGATQPFAAAIGTWAWYLGTMPLSDIADPRARDLSPLAARIVQADCPTTREAAVEDFLSETMSPVVCSSTTFKAEVVDLVAMLRSHGPRHTLDVTAES